MPCSLVQLQTSKYSKADNGCSSTTCDHSLYPVGSTNKLTWYWRHCGSYCGDGTACVSGLVVFGWRR